MVTTASGESLAKGGTLALREKELAPVLARFHALPENKRKPPLDDPAKATPAVRPVPTPPKDGLVIRGYCTYLQQTTDRKIARKPQFYYKENPDAWAAETQNDTLWLTAAEWKSLVPNRPRPGQTIKVAAPIQKRFFSTIGIDYMEGSVNALPTTDSNMTIKVDRVDAQRLHLTLDGHGQMGVPFDQHQRAEARSRGCAIRIVGRLSVDRATGRFERFDVVGVGKAWGNKMEYTRREIRIKEYPWIYGIACELVTTRKPADLIPPYNLVHYGSGLPYFAKGR